MLPSTRPEMLTSSTHKHISSLFKAHVPSVARTDLGKSLSREIETTPERESVETLVTLLDRQDTNGNQKILSTLAQIGKKLSAFERHTQIAVPLGELLKDIRDNPFPKTTDGFLSREEARGRNECLRQAILETLEHIDWLPDRSHIAAEYYIWKGEWKQCVALGAVAADCLVAAFKGRDSATREQAYLALVKIGTPVADKLVAALSEEKAEMRQSAYRALVKMGDAAIPELITALQDDFAQVRESAIQGLGEIGNPVVISAIIPHLNDPDERVRLVAYRSLGWFGSHATESLVHALKSRNTVIRAGVATILEKLGWKPENKTTEAYYWIASGQWVKCIAIGEAAVQPLIAELKSGEPHARRHALIVLVKMGNSATRPLLQAILNASPDLYRKLLLELAVIDDAHAAYLLRRIREAEQMDTFNEGTELV